MNNKKIKKKEWTLAGGMAQVIGHLSSKLTALNSNPVPPNNNNKIGQCNPSMAFQWLLKMKY
jgi:hypothetical protein